MVDRSRRRRSHSEPPGQYRKKVSTSRHRDDDDSDYGSDEVSEGTTLSFLRYNATHVLTMINLINTSVFCGSRMVTVVFPTDHTDGKSSFTRKRPLVTSSSHDPPIYLMSPANHPRDPTTVRVVVLVLSDAAPNGPFQGRILRGDCSSSSSSSDVCGWHLSYSCPVYLGGWI